LRTVLSTAVAKRSKIKTLGNHCEWVCSVLFAITIAKGKTKKIKSAIDLFSETNGIIRPITRAENKIKYTKRDFDVLNTILLNKLEIPHKDDISNIAKGKKVIKS